MNIVAIIQARMGSSRLPGKVLLQLKGHSVLYHVIKRVKAAKEIDKIIIATTNKKEDDEIVNEALKSNVISFRGSENDVLSRYYHSAVNNSADIIVRITSDCPLIDPGIISKAIKTYTEQEFDYISNTIERSYPRGLDVEVFSFDSLYEAYRNAIHPEEREHVTPYIYKHPSQFKIASFNHDLNYSDYRWTLDTPEDWMLIERIYENLYVEDNLFDWTSVLELMEKHPELPLINSHVEQKKLTI